MAWRRGPVCHGVRGMSSDTDRRRELEESIAESSEFIAAHGDVGADPVLGERLAVAHYRRARALKGLDRHREGLGDWDRFLQGWAALHPEPEGPRRTRLVVALALKSESLWRIGRRAESTLLDEEIAERFGRDEEPAVRWFVTMALIRRAQKLLRRPDGLEGALSASDALIRRFSDVEEERLEDAAELMLGHVRHLIALRGTSFTDFLTSLAEFALMSGIATTEALVEALGTRSGAFWLDAVGPLLERATPVTVRRHRRRQAQALKVLAALAERLEGRQDEDLAALAVQARFLSAAVVGGSGRMLEAIHQMEKVWAGRDRPTVQALAALAEREAHKASWMSQLNAITLLSRRATSLVGEDPRLARLAYEDSVAAQLGERLSPAVRLAVRLMRPDVNREGR
jgi:hypothetical protein